MGQHDFGFFVQGADGVEIVDGATAVGVAVGHDYDVVAGKSGQAVV